MSSWLLTLVSVKGVAVWAVPTRPARCLPVRRAVRRGGAAPTVSGMGRYVIERGIPGAGQLSEQEQHDIRAKSNELLSGMEDVSWVESNVAADTISPVRTVISPETGR